MQTIQRKPFRMLAALGAGTVLTFGVQMTAAAAPLENAVTTQDNTKMEHDWARHRQEQMKTRLAKAAEHLRIQPNQQAAWEAYANAIESPIGNAQKADQGPTDAAGIARHRADIAAAYAAKMMNIAETTASLQAVLTPEQQRKFDEMVRHARHGGDRDWRHPHASLHGNATQRNDAQTVSP
ncbi:MAG TPA: Spy/CpxP family protein refolding chaperone [Oxalicibacterium sp.]|uniref:Spy/CpxP family protein refolding chaperone n=1 Tax=Oxalicibacterium sp. TaxID=2766525 RepID=UPI002B7ED61E|nr:Spy/CpxP family protein refolding chaperone [Oxalicibacterium sp.]HWU98133.1 Spy/CpxP family protein refolding chaperone [Oxalicibacterium sp.]